MDLQPDVFVGLPGITMKLSANMTTAGPSNHYHAKHEGAVDVHVMLENSLWNIRIFDLTKAPPAPTPYFPGPRDLETAKKWALALAQGYILDNKIRLRLPRELSWDAVDSD